VDELKDWVRSVVYRRFLITVTVPRQIPCSPNVEWIFRENDLPLVQKKVKNIPTVACMAAVTVSQTDARRRPVENNHPGYMFNHLERKFQTCTKKLFHKKLFEF